MCEYTPSIAQASLSIKVSTTWYQHPSGIIFTKGVHWLCETLVCYWLINDIATYTEQYRETKGLLIIEFKIVNEKAVLDILDEDETLLYRFNYPYCDLIIHDKLFNEAGFEPKIQLYLKPNDSFQKHVLFLSSELPLSDIVEPDKCQDF